MTVRPRWWTVGAAIGLTAVPSVLAGPPVLPHVIVSQPSSDGVALEEYTAGVPVTVQVLRGGVLVATSQPVLPVTDGPGTTAEVNSPAGGACWQAITPDIVAGDVIRAIQAGVAEDATTQDLTVTAAIDGPTLGTDVQVTGTARTPAGQPLALDGLESLLSHPDFDVGGGPFIRALGAGGGNGTLAFTPPGGDAWTATYPGLNAANHATALAAASFASWTDGGEVTEVEFGATPGGQGACTAPLTRYAATSSTPPAFVFDSTALAVHGIAGLDADTVSVTVSDGTPVTPDVLAGPVALTTTGGGKAWTVNLSGSAIASLGEGPMTITPTFATSGGPVVGRALIVTKDTVPPDVTAPVATIVSGPKAVTNSRIASFDLAANEPASFQCRLDAGAFTACADPTVLFGMTSGAHTLAVRAVDRAGNVSPEVIHRWRVDLFGPIVSPTLPVARRALLTNTGLLMLPTRCNERCVISMRARILVPGGTPRVFTVALTKMTIPAGATGLPRARLKPAQLRSLRRGLATGRTIRIFVAVDADDAAGNHVVRFKNFSMARPA